MVLRHHCPTRNGVELEVVEPKVHGRGGEPCGKKLVTTHTIDLRATTFCPNCQR